MQTEAQTPPILTQDTKEGQEALPLGTKSATAGAGRPLWVCQVTRSEAWVKSLGLKKKKLIKVGVRIVWQTDSNLVAQSHR